MRHQREFGNVPDSLVGQLADELLEELALEFVGEIKSTLPLSDSDKAKAEQLLLSSRDDHRILVKTPAGEITASNMAALADSEWLDDELINGYLERIMERNRLARADAAAAASHNKMRLLPPTPVPRIHCFNSFLMVKLMTPSSVAEFDYASVRRWSKRAGVRILDLDKVFVPVHEHGNHWCLAVINVRDRRFEYYDSLGGKNPSCLKALRFFVENEHREHSPELPLDLSTWSDLVPDPYNGEMPLQRNGSDCGVFALKFAEYLAEDRDLSFSQSDMPYFRRRIALELCASKRVL